MKKIAIINGPNLNLLGTREPEIYGYTTLKDIENECLQFGKDNGVEIIFNQSNLEGEIVNLIQHASQNTDAIIINAAAYTHTSVAIYDALKASPIPFVEIHISNPHAREEFRHFSYISKIADGIIAGFGKDSYIIALQALAQKIASS